MLTGIVPMGGSAERWYPYPCPKELLPFGKDSKGRPRVIADYVIERMVMAGVEQVILPIKEDKAYLVMKYLGNCLLNGAPIIYTAAPGPTLLANLQSCIPYIRDQQVLFGMPDTYFVPENAFTSCLEALKGSYELALGCFLHDHPKELDLVDRWDSTIIAVRPKPRPEGENGKEIWGIAAWGAAFTARLAEWSSSEGNTPGFVFNKAARAGSATGVLFSDGYYEDIADYPTYQKALSRMEKVF